MGDGGSYFLGYTIACFSIHASVKSQVGATLLIPLLALGVPIFDTVLSPIRRFILGKKMFHPDRGHIHHRLIDMGISTKQAVWIIYGISAVLCIFAILFVNIRDKTAGLLLIILAAGSVILFRKLGYLEYIAMDKIYGWLRDVTDVTGFSRERRSFLSIQIEISASKSMDEVWKNLCRALNVLKFSRAELIVGNYNRKLSNDEYRGVERRVGIRVNPHHPEIDSTGRQYLEENEQGKRWIWTRGPYRRSTDVENKNGFLKMEIPLLNESNCSMGTLVLIRDLRQDPLDPFTIRRVEHLRRTLTNALQKLKNQG
jgi:UDP-GlcNAc:undecaprenyl-phosphate GlcNAc-1-phosphate transferase